MFDPTSIRLSKHFLLSDFIGCSSVYLRGYANVFDPKDKKKLQQGKYLAEFLEKVIEDYGPLSISYGYISPDLSEKIVTYQDPKKPSYHRWEIGAAADICVHDWVQKKGDAGAPIHLANEIDFNPFTDWYSRMITYSESPYICIATNIDEDDGRRAFYENRYEGVRKPRFISKLANRVAPVPVTLQYPWRGAGHPTYHGGGGKQLHHYRVGKYAMLTDFLYSSTATQEGYKNAGTPSVRMLTKFEAVGNVYSELVKKTGIKRFSIVRAYEHPSWSNDDRFDWKDECRFEIVPPEGVKGADIAEAVSILDNVSSVGYTKIGNIIRIAVPSPARSKD